MDYGIELLEARIAPATIKVVNLLDSGTGSLRDAISTAAVGDTIVFKSSLHGTIDLLSTLTVDKSLTIKGGGKIVLDYGNHSSLAIDDGNTGTLSNVTISGFTVQHVLDGWFDGENLTLKACKFTNSFNGVNSGVISVASGGVLDVEGCTFSHISSDQVESANGNAGVISSAGAVTIVNSKFTSNVAEGSGGAIVATSGSLTIKNSIFSKNNAWNTGGAIWADGADSVSLTGVTFQGNNALTSGAVDLQDVTTITVSGCHFLHNLAENQGALYVNETTGSGGSVSIKNSTFTGNTAVQMNGALALNLEVDLTATISHCVVTGNTAKTGSGGGMSLSTTSDGAAIDVVSTVISGNRSGWSGAGLQVGSLSTVSTITVSKCVITGNSALTGDGGGIYLEGGVLEVSGSLVEGNKVQGSNNQGGGIYAGYGALTLSQSEVTGNQAETGGGVLVATSLGVIYTDGGGNTIKGNFGGNLSEQ
ncbi:MAG: right-handed parallel beta-helix repeat-containing protein [Chthoniobacteraceae bacterium]